MSRAVRVVGGLLVCVLAVAGCATMAALQRLNSEIQAAGYANVNVNHRTADGHAVLLIEALRNETLSSADADEIAEIVWTTNSVEFDELQVVLNGQLLLRTGPDALRDRFGERPDEPAADTSSGGLDVTALVVILACAAAFAVLLVLMWRRGRPRRGPTQPYPGPYRYGPPRS